MKEGGKGDREGEGKSEGGKGERKEGRIKTLIGRGVERAIKKGQALQREKRED